MHGEPPLDPPDDPPLVDCPRCEGHGQVQVLVPDAASGEPNVEVEDCPRCGGDREVYLTDDEVRGRALDAAEDAAERRAESRGL